MEIIKSHIDIGTESRPGRELKHVMAVVMHWTGVPKQTAQTVMSWWDDDNNGVYGSAHFVIDISGKIYESIPPNEVAYHCGSAENGYTEFAKAYFGPRVCSRFDSPNNYTIGIEMIPIDSEGNYSDSTYQSAVALVKALKSEHKLNNDNILMHSHIRRVDQKRCPKLWVDDPAEWELFKMKLI